MSISEKITAFLKGLRDCRTRGPSPGLHKHSVKTATEILRDMEGREEPKEWIERLDNPQLAESELFDLEMEADYYARYDLMEEYRREADMCGDDFDPKEGP